MGKLNYTVTNETLDEIMAGMNPGENDVILATGGSGDQGFALLEKAKKVIIIDYDRNQIRLIQERYEALKQGDYEKFLRVEKFGELDEIFNTSFSFNKISAKEFLRRRNEYFQQDGRMERIRENIDNLQIEHKDMFKINIQVSKIYLSSLLSYITKDISLFEERAKNIPKRLARIAKKIHIGGLIYASNHADMVADYRVANGENLSMYKMYQLTLCEHILPKSLVLDKDLTLKAHLKEKERWIPGVYRKIT